MGKLHREEGRARAGQDQTETPKEAVTAMPPKKSLAKSLPKKPKPTKPRKPAPKKERSEYVDELESEKMFRRWCQIKDAGKGGGFKGVAKEFGRDIKTVRRIADKDKWRDRWAKILADIQRDTDRKVTKEEISNLRLVRALRDKVWGKLLKEDTDLEPDVKDALAVIRLEEELIGNLPGTPGESDNDPVPKEDLDKALNILEKMGEQAIQALGRTLVQVAREQRESETK